MERDSRGDRKGNPINRHKVWQQKGASPSQGSSSAQKKIWNHTRTKWNRSYMQVYSINMKKHGIEIFPRSTNMNQFTPPF